MRINQLLNEIDFLVAITCITVAVNTLIRFDKEFIAYFGLLLIEEQRLAQYIRKIIHESV